eukprot:6203803-Pleurochrysis_carterae.AAC.3
MEEEEAERLEAEAEAERAAIEEEERRAAEEAAVRRAEEVARAKEAARAAAAAEEEEEAAAARRAEAEERAWEAEERALAFERTREEEAAEAGAAFDATRSDGAAGSASDFEEDTVHPPSDDDADDGAGEYDDDDADHDADHDDGDVLADEEIRPPSEPPSTDDESEDLGDESDARATDVDAECSVGSEAAAQSGRGSELSGNDDSTEASEGRGGGRRDRAAALPNGLRSYASHARVHAGDGAHACGRSAAPGGDDCDGDGDVHGHGHAGGAGATAARYAAVAAPPGPGARAPFQANGFAPKAEAQAACSTQKPTSDFVNRSRGRAEVATRRATLRRDSRGRFGIQLGVADDGAVYLWSIVPSDVNDERRLLREGDVVISIDETPVLAADLAAARSLVKRAGGDLRLSVRDSPARRKSQHTSPDYERSAGFAKQPSLGADSFSSFEARFYEMEQQVALPHEIS